MQTWQRAANNVGFLLGDLFWVGINSWIAVVQGGLTVHSFQKSLTASLGCYIRLNTVDLFQFRLRANKPARVSSVSAGPALGLGFPLRDLS